MNQRSISLPFNYTPAETTFASQEPKQTHYKSTVGQMTPEDIRKKIVKFEINKKTYESILRSKLSSVITDEKTLRVYYFIGRLNPPHDGHIEALNSLIERAKTENPDENYKVIILLGSGPGKKQTLNDPLSFDFKHKVVIELLKKSIPTIDDLIISKKVSIKEMDRAAEQIATEIKTEIGKLKNLFNEVNTFRISGMKDADIKKLEWIEKALVKTFADIKNLTILTSVIGIAAVVKEDGATAMSATQVRRDALTGFITDGLDIENPDQGYQLFAAKYGAFYGANLGAVYSAIVEQAAGLTPDQIQAYIDSGALPKTKKGGSRKRKRRLTKRRKSRKHRKKLTKRRKSKRRIR
jgi:nicotinamide mononucleotide adenylyltransferase